MSRYSWALQQAIYGLLSSSSPSLAGGRVFDGAAPDGTLFPYVVIGETQALADDTSTSTDGDTSDEGVEETVTIHLWDRPNADEVNTVVGYKRVKQLADEVYQVMHKTAPSIAGRSSVLVEFDNDRFFMDQDGLTRHGVLNYRVFHRS